MTSTATEIDVVQKAKELIDIIKSRFINSESLLAKQYPPGARTLFDNFDDIVPFFIYFDETDFLLEQIQIVNKQKNPMLSLCACNGILDTRYVDEWFGGLHALWKATNDTTTYNLLQDSVTFIESHILNNGFLSASYTVKTNTASRYYESWSSGLLETSCEMRESFPKLFQRAQNVLRTWLQDDYFNKYHLFPYRIYSSRAMRYLQQSLSSRTFPISNLGVSLCNIPDQRSPKILLKKMLFYMSNGLYSQMMKSNSTCAFTLLEFYRVTCDVFWLDSLKKWIHAAEKYFYDDGKVYMDCIPPGTKKRSAGLVPSFIFVDVLCDTAYFAGERLGGDRKRYLNIAKNIIDHCWNDSMDTGLIPHFTNGDFAHIDGQVDFAVSLRRFAELTNQEE